MLKLIIADDEPIICQTIAKMIDWSALGIKLVGLCKDGIEAYNMILDESPDIVLTDIKMPGLSGLDLIKHVHESHLPIQFAILSGYGEFEFAKQAMQYGVKHYLLKPCNEHQIEECMLSIKEDCQKRKAIEALQERQNSLANMLHNTIITNVLREILTLKDEQEVLFSQYEQYLDVENQEYYLVEMKGLTLQKVEQILTRFESALKTKKSHASLHGVYVEGLLLLFFPWLGSDYLELDVCLKDSSSVLPQRVCYQSLKKLLKVVRDRVRCYGTIYCIHNFHISVVCNFKNVMDSFSSIVPLNVGESWDIGAIKEYLEGISNLDFLKQIIADLLLKSPATPMEVASFLLHLNQKQESAEIQELALAEFERLNESLKIPASAFMAKIEAILLEHLSNPNLSLKWISQNYLFMNVDYASRKILKESGKKFSCILAELRIQKAKQLLLEDNKAKMQTIAEQIGYGNNPQYFSQIFKKVTSLTPSEYIKKMKTSQ